MVVKALEYVLWAISATALCVYGLAAGERWLYQSYVDWEFAQMATGGPIGPEHFVRSLLGWEAPPPSGVRNMLSARRAVVRPTRAPARSPGVPLGRLEIPSIALSTILIEGTGDTELRRGIGHIAGTALPGESGNIGLAGHRDTFFRHLGEVEVGDLISLVTLEGTDWYIVDSIRIVNPDDAIVLNDIGRPIVTLVTCYPFHYFGSAPKRYIVHASRVSTPDMRQ
jgi:sortase A